MCMISVIMPVCNNEKHLHDAIESILKQSFINFELIISDFGSTDNTLSIVRSFQDKRIRHIANTQNHSSALNAGLGLAAGKYIALMYPDNRMHVDRLKIQQAIMEAEPMISVCGTRVELIGDKIVSDSIKKGPIGLIENPLLAFLQGNYLLHSTIMLRRAFLIEHDLCYENYSYAEDFRLWIEVAKHGGEIHIENQPLLYYRMTDEQEGEQRDGERQKAYENAINDAVEYLININEAAYPELKTVLDGFKKMQHNELMTGQDITIFFHNLFAKNKSNLIISYKQ